MKTENPLETSPKPPSSNRGVENQIVNLSIDWFAASFPLKGMETTEEVMKAVHALMGFNNGVVSVIAPRRGFNSAVQLMIGRLDIQDMRWPEFASVQLTGQEMQAFRAHGGKDDELFQRLVALGGSCSRADVAIDVKNDARASIRELEREYRNGEVETRSKASKLIEDLKTGGKTLYIGSRQSQTMLRAYNKAIESGILGELWTRLELEIKDKAADKLTLQIAKIGLQSSARWWFEKFRFQADWYTDMLRGMSKSTPPKLQKVHSEKKWWLEQQVIPALRKLAINEPDTLQWFLAELQAEFEEGKKSES